MKTKNLNQKNNYETELQQSRSAILNVLQDSKIDSEFLANSRKAILNVLEDLEINKQKLEEKIEELAIKKDKILHTNAVDEAILASIGDGLMVVGLDGRITYINNSFEKMTGWKSSEILGKLAVDVLPCEDEKGRPIPPEERFFIKVLKGLYATANLSSTAYYIRKDKTRFPVSSIVKRIVLNGNMIGVVKTFRDITQEKEIDKAKTEFVSMASHQLRTPLSSINWYTEMLLDGDAGKLNRVQKKYLQEIYNASKRMVGLVNSLLDVSRMDLGTFVQENKQVDVAGLAHSVILEQKSFTKKNKIKINSKFQNNIPIISIDPKHLRILIQNLLSNAVKYSHKDGEVEISLKTDKKKKLLILKISDSGYGIPVGEQDKIFSKLFRAKNVKERNLEGTGLGLYIVKTVTENLGGKVWFKSAEGKGTTFFVSLPY